MSGLAGAAARIGESPAARETPTVSEDLAPAATGPRDVDFCWHAARCILV
jgi:hypothetical protein